VRGSVVDNYVNPGFLLPAAQTKPQQWGDEGSWAQMPQGAPNPENKSYNVT